MSAIFITLAFNKIYLIVTIATYSLIFDNFQMEVFMPVPGILEHLFDADAFSININEPDPKKEELSMKTQGFGVRQTRV